MSSDLTTVSSVNPHLSRLQRASLNLQQALREAIQASRALYADANCADLFITIRASGRVHGDLKVEFVASDFSTTEVKSYDLSNSVIEFIKRKGWNDRHAPQCLTFSEDSSAASPADAEEVPF